MFGLARMILQFAWLGIMVLGILKAIELIQRGTDDMIANISKGNETGIGHTVVRLYEALLARMDDLGDPPETHPTDDKN